MLLVLFGTCVVLLVCVDCLFPLHDVLEPKGKRYGRSAGNSFSCSAKMASATDLQDTEDRPVPSSIARDRSLQSTSSFNEQQDCALVDYIQASAMAQYNK